MAYDWDDGEDMDGYSWWEMGQEAFHRGKFIESNPNRIGTKEHIDWVEGWNHAKYADNMSKDLAHQLII